MSIKIIQVGYIFCNSVDKGSRANQWMLTIAFLNDTKLTYWHIDIYRQLRAAYGMTISRKD